MFENKLDQLQRRRTRKWRPGTVCGSWLSVGLEQRGWAKAAANRIALVLVLTLLCHAVSVGHIDVCVTPKLQPASATRLRRARRASRRLTTPPPVRRSGFRRARRVRVIRTRQHDEQRRRRCDATAEPGGGGEDVARVRAARQLRHGRRLLRHSSVDAEVGADRCGVCPLVL